MNTLDIILLVGLGVSIIYSLIRGIVKEIVSLISFVAGFWVAAKFYPVSANILSGLTSNRPLANILGFLIILFIVGICVSLIGKIITRLIDISSLGWVDRLGGAIFGLVKGSLIAFMVVMLLVAFSSPQAYYLKTSRLAPHVINLSTVVMSFVPQKLKKQFEEKRIEAMEMWQKKISDKAGKNQL
jgi:membrane protein required for colicin V production